MNINDLVILIQEAVQKSVKKLYDIGVPDIHVEHPEESLHGDFSTNIAFILSKGLKQSPILVAKSLCYELQDVQFDIHLNSQSIALFKSIEFAPPGFINFTLSDVALQNLSSKYIPKERKNKVMVEYTDPNVFKVFHIGHLMTNAIGESLARILEYSGHEVKRANYQGDVGIHVAKSIWGLLKIFELEDKSLKTLSKLDLPARMGELGRAYALGSENYTNSVDSKEAIDNLNILIYKISQDMLVESGELKTPSIKFELPDTIYSDFDHTVVSDIYKLGKDWSLEYFETLYKKLNTKFDYYFFESAVAEYGYNFVSNNMKIFDESDGAVIFRGENYGLHTRVFVSSRGLPVYESKDLGLTKYKYEKYPYDMSIIVTADEISEYFKVVLQALSLIDKSLADKTTHISHGMMKNLDGSKFASRSGKVVAAVDLIDMIKTVIIAKMDDQTAIPDSQKSASAEKIAVAAIKFSILKQGLGNDILFDPETATNLSGNTGTYLLYTYARSYSLLEKGAYESSSASIPQELHNMERELLRHLILFPEVVEKAASDLAPHVIANYAFDLCQKFNAYYSVVPILDSEPTVRAFRLHLVSDASSVLKECIGLLGMPLVEKM